jgi:hypothetical protein
MITYPLTLPLSSYEYTLTKFQQAVTTQSPYSGSLQVQEGQAQYFELVASFQTNSRANMAAMIAAITALKGSVGTFYFGPQGDETLPRGIATGTPRVNGAGQSGSSTIVTDGWTVSQTGIMKAGDWISINNHLHIVLEDANSDSSGNATLSIWPKVRTSTNDNDVITVNNPKGIFRLKSGSQDHVHTAGGFYRIADIQATEDL